jgi:hypothetical protein
MDINNRKVQECGGKVVFYYLPNLKDKTPEEVKNLLGSARRSVVALLVLPDKTVFKGEAICSRKDMFTKKKGRDIALGRAISYGKRQYKYNKPTDYEKNIIEGIKF